MSQDLRSFIEKVRQESPEEVLKIVLDKINTNNAF